MGSEEGCFWVGVQFPATAPTPGAQITQTRDLGKKLLFLPMAALLLPVLGFLFLASGIPSLPWKESRKNKVLDEGEVQIWKEATQGSRFAEVG